MTGACPECGAGLEYSPREVRLLTGTCGGCGKTSYVLAGGAPGDLDVAPATPAGGSKAEGDDEALECGECGGALTVEATSETELTATCAECHRRLVFDLRGPEGRPERRPTGDRPRGGEGGRPFDRPPSRPCRECGGQLRFSTGEDGMVVGECTSCGNRFTLPPRRESGPGRPSYGRGRPGSYDRRGGRSGPGGGRPGGGRYGSSYRGARRPPRRDDDEDDDQDRRRRRRD